MRVIFSLALAATVTACAQFPELDHLQTAELAASEYPALLPLDQLLEGPEPRATAAGLANHTARAAGLRARAARLTAVRPGRNGDLSRRIAGLRQRAAAFAEKPH
jgi:hypothetical protein